MQDGARFFAYSTWVVMISLAIILFTNPFLRFTTDTGWFGIAVMLAFGFIYLNLSYAAVKRFIRKVPTPTRLHYLLALLVFLPPAIWITATSRAMSASEFLLLAVLAASSLLGTILGNRKGIKARYEYIQTLRQEASRDGA